MNHRRANKKRTDPRCRWLYAMRIGGHLKVGFATNVEKRRVDYLTSAPEVIVEHVIRIGTCTPGIAKLHEARLHDRISQFRISREIYRLEALEVVKQYHPSSLGIRELREFPVRLDEQQSAHMRAISE